MRRNWKIHGLRIAAFGILGVAVAGAVTMALWNSLMPAVLRLPAITFWQALGLLLLSRLFFGGFRGPGRRRRFARGWESLTPEERERFHQGMSPEQRESFAERLRARCGSPSSGNPSPESPAPEPRR